MSHQFIYQIILDFLYNIIICTLEHVQGSQILQIWRILSQNFSDESAEVTEGVTSTPEIFGNKQGATLTPVRNTVTVLSSPFSQQIQFTLIVNVANLNKIIEIKVYCTTKQEEGKLRTKFTL